MTLFDREALNLYIEGAKANLNHRVVPMDVSKIAHEVDIIYTCTYSEVDMFGNRIDRSFAIGKVKRNPGQRF